MVSSQVPCPAENTCSSTLHVCLGGPLGLGISQPQDGQPVLAAIIGGEGAMGLREKTLAKPHLAVLARCPRLRLERPWDEGGPSRPSSNKTNAFIWWRVIWSTQMPGERDPPRHTLDLDLYHFYMLCFYISPPKQQAPPPGSSIWSMSFLSFGLMGHDLFKLLSSTWKFKFFSPASYEVAMNSFECL